jgi:SAM-dependent methyltransferase
MSGARVLGFGYAIPYLDAWRADAERVIAFMPARQGVVHWPASGLNATGLVDEADLPLPDNSVDLALVIHGLELAEQLPDLLRELWRVLAAQGRGLFVVPNRRGMWARFDSTPFGHGRPYSRSQLAELLRDAEFSPTGWAYALFAPPIGRSFLIRSAPAWERAGLWLSPGFAGLIVVEAVKQVYATSRKRSRRLVPVIKRPLIAVPSPAAGQWAGWMAARASLCTISLTCRWPRLMMCVARSTKSIYGSSNCSSNDLTRAG